MCPCSGAGISGVQVDKSRQRKENYEEYSLAFALSQMFSPKQKESLGRGWKGCP